MSEKRQKKNIVSNQSLYGAESDTELTPREKKSEKTKSKVSKKILVAVNEFAGVVKDFLVDFLTEQGSGKIRDILSSWQSEETQSKLTEMIKMRMPVPEPIKPRKPKDPNAPKRPRSAYILFCNDKRAEIKKANPEMKMPDIAKKLGEMWRSLKDKKKQPYLEEATKDKSRYDTEMGEYNPNNKPKGPKRATTSYFFFCADKRAEVKQANPDMKVTEIAKELGRMWKEDFADEKSRRKWVKAAEKDKERYEQEKATWISENPEEVKNVPKKKNKKTDSSDDQDALVQLKSKRSKKSQSIQASGMILYMQRARPEIEAENPEWDTREVVAEMKKRWASLSTEERSEYDQ